jgi:hypothetical protein
MEGNTKILIYTKIKRELWKYFKKINSYFFNTIQFLTSIGLTAHDSECGITDPPLTNELITMTIYGCLSMIAQHIAYYCAEEVISSSTGTPPGFALYASRSPS